MAKYIRLHTWGERVGKVCRARCPSPVASAKSPLRNSSIVLWSRPGRFTFSWSLLRHSALVCRQERSGGRGRGSRGCGRLDQNPISQSISVFEDEIKHQGHGKTTPVLQIWGKRVSLRNGEKQGLAGDWVAKQSYRVSSSLCPDRSWPPRVHSWVSEWKSLSCVQLFATPWTIHSPWNSPGQNTGVGSLSLLQDIFPTQGSNPGLPHCRRILYQLGHRVSQRSF